MESDLSERQRIDARNKLVEDNLELARWAVHTFARRSIAYNPHLFDDLCQVALIGLMRAAEKWDPNKGTFATYARDWMRQKIWRELSRSRLIKLPTYLKREERRQAIERTDPIDISFEMERCCYEEEAITDIDTKDYQDWVVSESRKLLTSCEFVAFYSLSVLEINALQTSQISKWTRKSLNNALTRAKKKVKEMIDIEGGIYA